MTTEERIQFHLDRAVSYERDAQKYLRGGDLRGLQWANECSLVHLNKALALELEAEAEVECRREAGEAFDSFFSGEAFDSFLGRKS